MSTPLQPRPTPDTEGFWAATADGKLALAHCAECSRFTHPPLERCPRCASPMSFEAVSGRGTLFSYIVVHRAIAPGYQDKPGHVIGLVELDDQPGLRLSTQLAGVTADTARIGMPLRADIVALPGGDLKVPVFTPVTESPPA
jgi:uncharacterized OB-fold protein